jgi:DNA uptake protein ComE-like DNA-binding protein
MKAGLRLINDQVQKIVAERDARGDFLDYEDFVRRTGFSEEECARFKKYLEFTATYTRTQINYATGNQIKAGLRLTDSQAQKIVAERDAGGEFPDYDNFVRRTGFTKEECGRFRRWLDFIVSTKINYATEAEMRAQLGLTASNAKHIISARKAHGNFLDLHDFMKKTRFSNTACRGFKKYLDFTIRPSEPQLSQPEQKPLRKASQPVMNDSAKINLDKIIREAQADTPARLPVIKINYASETEIRERLGVTIIQAKMIVSERKTQGDYLDYGDFVNRTGLSERACSRFKDDLDFTINHSPNRKQGRVLDI